MWMQILVTTSKVGLTLANLIVDWGFIIALVLFIGKIG
jgi:hypothetical protein